MTESSEDARIEQIARGPARDYASDRHLLLKEIKMLGSEVARLRGDTKHLSEVLVPREEIIRRRRAAMMVAGIAFLLLSVPMIGFYLQQQKINTDREQFTERTIALCEKRNQGNRDLEALVEVILTENSDAMPTNEVVKALADYKRTLQQTDCQSLVTDD